MKKREFIRLAQNIEFYSLPEFSYYVHHNVKDAPICTSEGRNIKEHGSYSTAVNIYSCDDGLVGVEGVYERFNECSEWVDFGIVCTACEYEAFQTIGYQPKN
jgi:hypothetical protein